MTSFFTLRRHLNFLSIKILLFKLSVWLRIGSFYFLDGSIISLKCVHIPVILVKSLLYFSFHLSFHSSFHDYFISDHGNDQYKKDNCKRYQNIRIIHTWSACILTLLTFRIFHFTNDSFYGLLANAIVLFFVNKKHWISRYLLFNIGLPFLSKVNIVIHLFSVSDEWAVHLSIYKTWVNSCQHHWILTT